MHGPEALQEVPGAVSGRRESLHDEGALRSLRQRLPAELESPGFGCEIVRLSGLNALSFHPQVLLCFPLGL